MAKITFGVYLSHLDAVMPSKTFETDAGFDLCSVERLLIKPQERVLAHTGIHVQIKPGWELQIRPRSGNALNLGLSIVNSPGTIDANYTGELMVILYNTSKKVINLPKGAKIAQMVIKQVPVVTLKRLSAMPAKTGRGHRGYGSSGLYHTKNIHSITLKP